MPAFDKGTVRSFAKAKGATLQDFAQMDVIATAGWGVATTPAKGVSPVTSAKSNPALQGGACLGYSALYLSKSSFSDFASAASSSKGEATVRGLANINYAAEYAGAFKTTTARYDSYKQMMSTLGLTFHSYREGPGEGGPTIKSFISGSDEGRYLVLLWTTNWRGHAIAVNTRTETVFDPNWGEAKFSSSEPLCDFVHKLCSWFYSNFKTSWLVQRYTGVTDDLMLMK